MNLEKSIFSYKYHKHLETLPEAQPTRIIESIPGVIRIGRKFGHQLASLALAAIFDHVGGTTPIVTLPRIALLASSVSIG